MQIVFPVVAALVLCYNAAVRQGMNAGRNALKLILLGLAVLLLGLAPHRLDYVDAMRRAEAHRAAGEYGAAVAAYRQAAEAAPEDPQPWLARGQVLLDRHQFLPATAAFLEAARLGAGREALFGLGQSYAGRGDWAGAMEHWLPLLEANPDDAGVHVALGQSSLDAGRFEQAGAYMVRALELDPEPKEAAAAHAVLGRLAAGRDPAEAEEHLRLAGDADMLAVVGVAGTEADPARRALLLGVAALQRNELALARQRFEEAVALAPDDAEAVAYLAHSLDRLGKTVAARDLLARAQALESGQASPLVYYFLGTHERLVGNVAAAQAAFWEALQRDPLNAALRVEMAEAFLMVPDYAMAEEWYVGAVEVAPDDVEFRLLLARFYVDHLYRVEAGGVPAAQAAVDLAPDDARAYDLLGRALHLAGRPSEGEAMLVQALLLDPDLVSAHYHLGSLYASTGRYALARQHLQRAADLDRVGFYRNRAEQVLEGLPPGAESPG